MRFNIIEHISAVSHRENIDSVLVTQIQEHIISRERSKYDTVYSAALHKYDILPHAAYRNSDTVLRIELVILCKHERDTSVVDIKLIEDNLRSPEAEPPLLRTDSPSLTVQKLKYYIILNRSSIRPLSNMNSDRLRLENCR